MPVPLASTANANTQKKKPMVRRSARPRRHGASKNARGMSHPSGTASYFPW